MPTKRKLPLDYARNLAGELCAELTPFFSRLLIAGSIRRERETIGDIDLVGIPTNRNGLGMALYQLTGAKINVTGKIASFRYRQTPVDLYLCAPQDFYIVALIRTGSAKHNAWLATRAKRRGTPLTFSEGIPGVTFDAIDTLEIAEQKIFAALGMDWIAPAQREANAPHTRRQQQ